MLTTDKDLLCVNLHVPNDVKNCKKPPLFAQKREEKKNTYRTVCCKKTPLANGGFVTSSCRQNHRKGSGYHEAPATTQGGTAPKRRFCP